MRQFLLFLTLLASLNPLLTAAHLWQMKEWRWDRLLEHLHHEPWPRQVFGVARPVVFLMFFLLGALESLELPLEFWDLGVLESSILLPAALLAYILVSSIQFVLKRQPRPHLTAKTLALLTVSLALTAIPAWYFPAYLPAALPILQPFFLIAAWFLLWPLDQFLKRRIVQRAAAVRASHPNLTVIGITGSVGKTTTKELLLHILERQDVEPHRHLPVPSAIADVLSEPRTELRSDARVLATPGHVNTEVGVAKFLKKHLAAEHRFLIVEMGAYAPGEIAALCSLTKPTVGAITFIGSQHLALFGSLEALSRAKAELLESLPESGRAFLNADSERCAELASLPRCPVVTVGTGGQADVNAESIEETPEGLKFAVGGQLFFIPIRGTHQVANILLAVSIARDIAGLTLADCSARLRSFQPLRDTFEVTTTSDGVVILNDTHNASPESFRAAIEWAQGQPAERRILVTPGIIELGEREDRIHEELGLLARPVFQEVYFLSRHCLQHFSRGYGRPVPFVSIEQLPTKMKSNTLIACVGRIPRRALSTLAAT
jgi:UDP-N-acetylmuramyl pentapeptide synthase